MRGNSAFLAVFYQSLLLLLFLTSGGLTCSLSFDSIDLFWVLGNLLVGSRGPRLPLIWVSRYPMKRRLSGEGTRQNVGMCGASSPAS